VPFETVADIEGELQETDGKPVTYAGTDTWGHLDEPTRSMLDRIGPGALGFAKILTVPTDRVAGLESQQQITVDGEDWQVGDFSRSEGDGKLTHIGLTKSTRK